MPDHRSERLRLLGLGACVAAAIVAAGGPLCVAAKSSGSGPDPVASVISLVVHRNSDISSYQAHARLDVRQLNFPYLHPVLNGTEYYSRPGFTVFDFPHVPSYLKGITKVEGAVYAANRWERCYDISLTKLPDAYALHMTPKVRGEVSGIDVTVGHAGQIHHMDWYYRNPGDHISLDQYYGIVLGYSVVTVQQSQITLHHIRAAANGSFDNFTFNAAVPTPTPTPADPLHQCDN